jgi:UDP-3-O-[3-hydroxymyristoyl] glucosamine N-acyltransferase
MYFKMVRTRQGTIIDSTLVQEGESSLQYEGNQEEDPLVDIASHIPATFVHSKRECYNDYVSHHAKVSLFRAANRYGQTHKPSSMALVVMFNPYLDHTLLKQLVKVMVAGMAEVSSTTHRTEKVTIMVY